MKQNDFTTNQRMSIQEIGQRIEKAIQLCENDFENLIQNCQQAFDGHPLWKVIQLSIISSDLDLDYLRSIAIEMKNWNKD